MQIDENAGSPFTATIPAAIIFAYPKRPGDGSDSEVAGELVRRLVETAEGLGVKYVPLLKAEGLRLGLVKHAHHGFELDQPGKDSYELRKAGADQTVVTSCRRIASIIEFRDQRPEPGLAETLTALRSELSCTGRHSVSP